MPLMFEIWDDWPDWFTCCFQTSIKIWSSRWKLKQLKGENINKMKLTLTKHIFVILLTCFVGYTIDLLYLFNSTSHVSYRRSMVAHNHKVNGCSSNAINWNIQWMWLCINCYDATWPLFTSQQGFMLLPQKHQAFLLISHIRFLL